MIDLVASTFKIKNAVQNPKKKIRAYIYQKYNKKLMYKEIYSTHEENITITVEK